MEGNGRVSARFIECEQNVVSNRKIQIWRVTGKYSKRQEMNYFIAAGKVWSEKRPPDGKKAYHLFDGSEKRPKFLEILGLYSGGHISGDL